MALGTITWRESLINGFKQLEENHLVTIRKLILFDGANDQQPDVDSCWLDAVFVTPQHNIRTAWNDVGE